MHDRSVISALAKGVGLGRYVQLLHKADGMLSHALEIAEGDPDMRSTPQVLSELRRRHAHFIDPRHDPYTRDVSGELRLKVAVEPMGTAPGSPLSPLTDIGTEFVALERPRTVLASISVRRVPFGVSFLRVDSGATVRWVGAGLAKPVTKIDLSTVSLGWAKVSSISVITKELAIASSVAAQAMIGQEIAAASAAFINTSFLDPSLAAIPNERPASITYGIPQVLSAGTSLANVKADALAAISRLSNANIPLQNAVWIMSELVAARLATMQDTAGAFVFPTISAIGGTWFGIPVITSNAVQQSGSPTESFIVLLDGQSVAVADDGQVELGITKDASLIMDDAPNAPASQVSLWQQNKVGVRSERYVNWIRRRDAGVAVIGNVNY
ncbi:MAG: phage major capsid protein [Casimicrobiaceae bacterium]